MVGGSGARRSVLRAARSLGHSGGTSADGLVSGLVALEVGGEFFELGLAALGGDDAFLSEDDSLGPLRNAKSTSVIFSSSFVSLFLSRPFYAYIYINNSEYDHE